MNTPNGEIPSVGKVDMAWISTPLPPIPKLSPSPAPFKNGRDRDDDIQMEEGDAMVATSSPARHGQGDHSAGGGGGHQQENLDYDVADDNDWGPE